MVLKRATVSLLGLAVLAGCRNDVAPAPEPTRVPGAREQRMPDDLSRAKPLPDQSGAEIPAPPFNDVPLVSQEAPETARFVDAYNHVGRPRMLIWISGTSAPGYDEAAARAIDYTAMQAILADWFSAGGAVAIISNDAARQSLAPDQAGRLDGGQPVNGKDLADRIHADVLVSVRAEPTRQSGDGPAVRLVAEASNLAGGESIGRAVVDVPPPLDKPRLNAYTRFLARKLMRDMTGAWTAFGTAAPANEPPTTSPAAR